MKSAVDTSRVWSAWFAMALMAVLVRAVIPTGFMIAPERGLNLVICSGSSHTVGRTDGETPSKAPPKSEQPCAFAGFHAATATEGAIFVAVSRAWVVAEPRLPSLGLAPGRGLAAPPPPSHAPPSHHV